MRGKLLLEETRRTLCAHNRTLDAFCGKVVVKIVLPDVLCTLRARKCAVHALFCDVVVEVGLASLPVAFCRDAADGQIADASFGHWTGRRTPRLLFTTHGTPSFVFQSLWKKECTRKRGRRAYAKCTRCKTGDRTWFPQVSARDACTRDCNGREGLQATNAVPLPL